MVAMETIIMYPDSIFLYIGELQLIIFNISKKYFKYLTQSIHVWVLITNILHIYQKPKNVGFCPIREKYARNGPKSTQTVSLESTIKKNALIY